MSSLLILTEPGCLIQQNKKLLKCVFVNQVSSTFYRTSVRTDVFWLMFLLISYLFPVFKFSLLFTHTHTHTHTPNNELIGVFPQTDALSREF